MVATNPNGSVYTRAKPTIGLVMLDQNQISRLVAAGNALRPDWPHASLYTFLARNMSHRAYRDVACALAYIAADPETKTPARLLEAGPWWQTTRTQDIAPSPKLGQCDDCHRRHAEGTPCAGPGITSGPGFSEYKTAREVL